MKEPTIIFCKVVDATLDVEGNIHLILSKDNPNTSFTAAKSLKDWNNQDICLKVSELRRGMGQ